MKYESSICSLTSGFSDAVTCWRADRPLPMHPLPPKQTPLNHRTPDDKLRLKLTQVFFFSSKRCSPSDLTHSECNLGLWWQGVRRKMITGSGKWTWPLCSCKSEAMVTCWPQGPPHQSGGCFRISLESQWTTEIYTVLHSMSKVEIWDFLPATPHREWLVFFYQGTSTRNFTTSSFISAFLVHSTRVTLIFSPGTIALILGSVSLQFKYQNMTDI